MDVTQIHASSPKVGLDFAIRQTCDKISLAMSAIPPHSSLTNASLLSRVKNPDDVGAWREFESRYRDLLVRFCKSSTGGRLQQADAEDVAQAVLTSLFRAMPRFQYDRSKGRFRDYLFRCARNAISQIRGRKADRGSPNGTVPSLCLDEAVDSGQGTPDAGLESTWEREWVAHHYRLALDELKQSFDAKSVRIFEACLAGKSVTELQTMFDMTDQAIYKVRTRAKLRLEEIIARQIQEEDELGG